MQRWLPGPALRYIAGRRHPKTQPVGSHLKSVREAHGLYRPATRARQL
jgi:hypothetical protein